MNKEYTPKEREEAMEDFELFLFQMDDILEEFIEEAGNDGLEFDFSLNSLDQLEIYAESKGAKPETDFHGKASKYLGEVLRKNFGGIWILSLDMKENSLYYGKPVLINFSKYDTQFSPYNVIRSVLLRPRRNKLKQIVLDAANPKKLDLSHLPTEDPIIG